MTLYLIQYCLPLLVGYTMFISLAGRMNPFLKPAYPEERPSWFLGVWTGVTLSLVLGVCLQIAPSISLESAAALLPPAAFFMGVLSLPGIAGYSLYRRHVAREQREAPVHGALKQRLEGDSLWRADEEHQPRYSESSETDMADAASSEASIHTPRACQDSDEHAPIVASFLDSADLQVLDTHDYTAANSGTDEVFEAYLGTDFDLDNETTLDDYLDETVFEEFHYSDLDLDASNLDATSLVDMSDIAGAQPPYSTDKELAEMELFYDKRSAPLGEHDAEESPLSFQELAATELAAVDEALMFPSDPMSEDALDDTVASFDIDMTDLALASHSSESAQNLTEEPLFDLNDSSTTDNATTQQLEMRLLDELAAHEETSKQLRITRKVLARLTPSAQDGAMSPSNEMTNEDPVLSLKEELAESLSLQSAHLAEANSEKEKRLQAEEACSQMQQELIQAKHDVRRSTAARAKALSTANKAIAFARQTLQVRSLLEEELQMARNTLAKRQDTISSVIKELENEKERTQEEVVYMAQQLVVHDHLPNHQHADDLEHDDIEHKLPIASNGKMTETHRVGPEL